MAAYRLVRRPAARWVLTFHEVGQHRWATAPQSFRRIMEAVRASASIVGLEELLALGDEAPLSVAVSFDDGYLGVAKEAVPILDHLEAPATVFLPTDLLVEDDAVPLQTRGLYDGVPMMGWRTARRLSASSLIRVESHGSSHCALRGLSEDLCREDLLRSRETLRVMMGQDSRLLAYPFGAAGRSEAATAREVGFEAAFTTQHGALSASSDPFLLPRVDIRSDYTPADVLAILKGDWDFIGWAQALRGRRA